MKNAKSDSLEDRLAWIRQTLEIQQEAEDATDIVKTIKNDLSPDEVYVFTPKGDVISLPAGATVIDMAYAIHTAVGNRMVGAKVDRRIVPIDYQVKTGEIVEILTQKEGAGPKRGWLNIVKTNSAKAKIRAWFKKEKREENIVEGREIFERELKKSGMQFDECDLEECLSTIMQRQHCNTLDDFFASIGYGGIQMWKIMPRVKDAYQKKYKKEVTEPVVKDPTAIPRKKHVGSGVNVEGVQDCLIKFSRCCNPLPGDDIIGFITRGFGVSIHRVDCPNTIGAYDPAQAARWVRVRGDHGEEKPFDTTLELDCITRDGLLLDLATVMTTARVRVKELTGKDMPDGHSVFTVRFEVKNVAELESIRNRLMSIRDVMGSRRGQN